MNQSPWPFGQLLPRSPFSAPTPTARTASRFRRRRSPSPRPPTTHDYNLRRSGPDNLVSAASTMSGQSTAAPPTTASASAAIPATSAPRTTAPLFDSPRQPPNAMPPPADPTTMALDSLTTAIYGLQQQMGNFAARLAVVELRPGSSTPASGSLPLGRAAVTTDGSAPPASLPFGIPG